MPDILKRWTDTVTKPIKVWDLFGPLLGLLAIAPRITDNGKIGFQRLRTPIDTIADSVNLDSDVWELGGAAEASANLDDAPLINRISVKYGWNYRMGDDGEWYDPLEITWDDGINTLGHVRPFTYQIRGIHPTSRLELEREINAQVTATHYGLFGRLATSVEIPCTWTSRQFKCGDVVSVTHDLLPDVTEGAYGVTSRNGIILKKRHSSTGRQTDLLRVRIPPPNKGTGIAPCAHATSFTSSPNVLHFTSTTAYSPSGTSDLSWFSAGTKAWIIDYDSLSNSFTLADNQVNILSVGASHIKINEDLTTSFPSANGVYIYYPGYGAGNAAQDAYAHIASASTIPHLGGDEDAQEWTL